MDVAATVLGPLLTASGLLLHLGTTILFARYRKRPWGFLALSAFGLLYAVVRALSLPGTGTAVAAVASVALFAFTVWLLFVYSVFPERETRPAVGDRFPDFALRDTEGREFTLAGAQGRRLVVLLYRGSW